MNILPTKASRPIPKRDNWWITTTNTTDANNNKTTDANKINGKGCAVPKSTTSPGVVLKSTTSPYHDKRSLNKTILLPTPPKKNVQNISSQRPTSHDEKNQEIAPGSARSKKEKHEQEQPQREPKLKLVDADKHLASAYKLVWYEKRYGDAITSLREALTIQKAVHGTKYHIDIGWTHNFLGSTLWLSGDFYTALDHYCECQRVFVKSCCSCSGNHKTSSKVLENVNGRITRILEYHIQLTANDINYYHQLLRAVLDHEVQATRYKRESQWQLANEEGKKAHTRLKQMKDLLGIDASQGSFYSNGSLQPAPSTPSSSSARHVHNVQRRQQESFHHVSFSIDPSKS